MIAASVLLGIFLVSFVIYVLKTTTPTPLVVFPIPNYGSIANGPLETLALPPLDWAAEDRSRLVTNFPPPEPYRARLWERQGVTAIDPPPDTAAPKSNADRAKQFAAQLRKTRPGGPDENVILAYLSAHTQVRLSTEGKAEDKLEPCLIFENDDPLHPKSWLTLEELLKALAPEGDQ
ncbi:MAG: hypothetical protein NT069_30930, partial [Planctomycetota bacterium]|nr:hypothetical protein [Planctomycetota bacterium]